MKREKKTIIMTIIQTRKNGPTRKLLSLFTLSVFVLSSMRAEDVYVSSFVGATQTGCPPSCAVTGTSTTTTTVSSAPGVPTRSRALIGVVNPEYWHVTPTLAQSVGVYKIYITKGTSGNGSPNLVVAMTASGGDLADVGGTGAASINLTNFNSFSANNVWVHIGYITNNTTTPTINFDYVSGTTAATGGVGIWMWCDSSTWIRALASRPCGSNGPGRGRSDEC
jgi:hypothetical protein